MKKYTLLYIGAALAICSCGQHNNPDKANASNTKDQGDTAIEESNSRSSKANIVTKQIPIGAEFTHLIAISGANIVYTQGDYKMDVTGDSSLIAFLETDIESKILTVSLSSEKNQDINIYEGKQNVTINLSAPDLQCVSVCSSGDFTSKGMWKTNKLEFGMIGNGNLHCDSIECEKLDYQATGKGDAYFTHIKSSKSRFTNTSTSNVDANIETNLIIADNQGTSTFKFKGKAETKEIYQSKEGKILF